MVVEQMVTTVQTIVRSQTVQTIVRSKLFGTNRSVLNCFRNRKIQNSNFDTESFGLGRVWVPALVPAICAYFKKLKWAAACSELEPEHTHVSLAQPEPVPGWGSATRAGHGFLPNARENSKYPKGTLLSLNFSYLNHSIFHATFNAGLKSFYSFFSSFSYWIRPIFNLNIIIRKLNVWIYHVHPQYKENTFQHHPCISSNGSHSKFSLKFTWNSLFPNKRNNISFR